MSSVSLGLTSILVADPLPFCKAPAAEAAPYEVNDKETSTTAAATGAAPSSATAADAPASAPAAAAKPTPAAASAQPKKKGGLFSCCGKAEHYD